MTTDKISNPFQYLLPKKTDMYIDDNEFEAIRPYNDTELKPALKGITESKEFFAIAPFVFPDKRIEEVKEMLEGVSTAGEFQKVFMHRAVRRVVEESSDGLTFDGFDKLNPDTPYLFIANHRDIVLDSAILQVLLVEHNIATSEITFGSNLMISPFIVDFGKVNKMFTVNRSGSKLEVLENSRYLSSYIRYCITQKKSSVWIAQRNGRTKNGFDKTEEALLKMLNLSGEKGFIDNFSELNIVPLIVSYEYEPCGVLKVNELYQTNFSSYVKKPGEDLNSIITGFKQYKGHIHLSAGELLNEHIQSSDYGLCTKDNIRNLAQTIDNIMYRNYRLWKTNYMAYDLLYNSSSFSDHYSPEERMNFIKLIDRETSRLNGDKEVLRRIYLEMYANPVINKKTT